MEEKGSKHLSLDPWADWERSDRNEEEEEEEERRRRRRKMMKAATCVARNEATLLQGKRAHNVEKK